MAAERVCRQCGHGTFVAQQMVREEVVVYGDGSFIEVAGQEEIGGPEGPYRCRGCGARAETLEQLTVERTG